MSNSYDVAILGGGLAGLSLALQLLRARPDLRVLVAEKASHPPPAAAHKVGESTVELASHYFREVLGLREYLETQQLPKLGLRFFQWSRDREQVEHRLEVGATGRLPVPSHQLDRGTLEEELGKRVAAVGGTFWDGCRVSGVELDPAGRHRVALRRGEERVEIDATWIVDASGRASTLKRKLGLLKETAHAVNAVWWRHSDIVELEEWGEDPTWKSRIPAGMRRLSTNHLMGPGYWVWFIPLASGSTSVGIVADPDIHPLETYSTFERAVEWLWRHEPVAARSVVSRADKLQDFLVLRHFSHHAGRMFSTDRWALSGDAGAFLDPFYSPGSDFIALANTYTTDLILRDLGGERIGLRVEEYSRTYLEMIDSWLPVYQDMYKTFGHPGAATAKVLWDFGTYWAFQVPTFLNGGFTDLGFMAKTRGTWRKLTALNRSVQANLLAWARSEPEPPEARPGLVEPLALPFLYEMQATIPDRLDSATLTDRLQQRLGRLESFAAEILRRVSRRMHGTGEGLALDPYRFRVDGSEAGEVPGGPAISPNAEAARNIDVYWQYIG